jgi:DNA-binding NtrC family response regulator
MYRILVVDDEPGVRHSFRKLLEHQYRVETAEDGTTALATIEATRPDLVFMDIRMPGISGMEALERIKESHPDIPVVMMTAHGDTQKVIEAIRIGAYDYLVKPLRAENVLEVATKALRARRVLTRSDFTVIDAGPATDPGLIIGNSEKMIEVYKLIGQLAHADVTVLIQGESGTGKELVARAIHRHSRRSDAPFLVVNCAALPEALLESELFGYEAGAFTGATQKGKPGKFEVCNGGTFLLDEIGDMSLVTQAKVLRVLQDGRFQKIGGVEDIQVDVRILAATNKHLDAEIETGGFREDLYHRLNVVTVTVPPLRDRKEDIPPLVNFMIHRFNEQLGVDIKGYAPEFITTLQAYDWPGNVRELENVIKKAMVVCQTNILSLDDCHLPQEAGTKDRDAATPAALVDLAYRYMRQRLSSSDHPFDDVIREIEKGLVERTLQMTEGNQVRASHLLGIARTTLRKKIADYGIAGT